MKLFLFAMLVFAALPEIPGCEDDKNYDPSPITPIPRPEGEQPEKPPPGPLTPAAPVQPAAGTTDTAPTAPPEPVKKEEPAPKKSPAWELRVTGGACDAHVVSSARGVKADATARVGPKEASDKSTPSKKETDAFWSKLDGYKWWALENDSRGVIQIRMGQFSRSFNEGFDKADKIAADIRKLAGCDDAAAKAKKKKHK